MSASRVGRGPETGSILGTRYERTGAGTPVVLVHGVGLASAAWGPVARTLADRHEVIAIDMPGHGGSALAEPGAGLPAFARRIAEVLDHLGVPAAHLAGHSMGALVVLEAALAYPARVHSVTAMSAVYCRSLAQRAAVEQRAEALAAGEAPIGSPATIARWFGDPVPAPLASAAALCARLLDATDPAGYAHAYRLFAAGDRAHEGRLQEIACPALYLTGEHDPNSTPAMAAAMACATPRGELRIIAGARHMVALTAPEAVASALGAFLARVDRTRD